MGIYIKRRAAYEYMIVTLLESPMQIGGLCDYIIASSR